MPVHLCPWNNDRYSFNEGDTAKSDWGSQMATQGNLSCLTHRTFAATAAAPRGKPLLFWEVKVTSQSEKSLCLHLFASTSDHSLHSPSPSGEGMLISNAGVMKYFSYVFNYLFINIAVVMLFFLFLFCLIVSC